MLEPIDLLGRDAVDVLRIGPDELLPAAGDDVGAEAVGAQVVHHLEHRLVDELGHRYAEDRVLRLRQPVGDDRLEIRGAHAGMGDGDDLHPVLLAELGHRRMVAGQHRLEGLGLLPLGMLGRHLGEPVEGEEALAVERVLDPGGAVLVEGGDAVLGRHEVGAASVVVAATKSRIACFAAPSFQDGSGSSCARAWRPGQRARVAASVTNRARRLSAMGRSLAMSVSLSAAGAAELCYDTRAIPVSA